MTAQFKIYSSIVNMAVPIYNFNDGHKMPMIGFGTFMPRSGDIGKAVRHAIDIGYRHFDTAAFYQNEKDVGDAIREKIQEGDIKREDIFVTTKLWSNTHKENNVVPTCKKSLENLGLDYIDLYLIHWPIAFKESDEFLPKDASGSLEFADTDYLETWRGMEECKRLGLVRSIGVSNFNSEQITRLLSVAKIQPVNNQVEVSLNINQRPLIDFCRKHDISVTGYSPLANLKDYSNNPTIQTLSKKYGKTPAQITLRYVFQVGAAPIPKSVTNARIKENFEIFDFTLTTEEEHSIQSIATGNRAVLFKEAKQSKYYPFSIPF